MRCAMPNDDDQSSIGTIGSGSLGESIVSVASGETDRLRARLQGLRRRRLRRLATTTSGGSGTDVDAGSDTSRSSRAANGIMTVRTLQESLNESKITKLYRKRRRATLQLMHSRKNVLNETESRDDSGRYQMSIQFDRISIREYRVVCGDNPSVSTGPPVQLDWANIDHYNGSVDEFEDIRGGQRRVQTEMRLPETLRWQMLQHFGHSKEEIEECTKKASISKRQRFQTMATSEAFPALEENIERLTRMFSSPFRRKQKRAEDELWEKVQVM